MALELNEKELKMKDYSNRMNQLDGDKYFRRIILKYFAIGGAIIFIVVMGVAQTLVDAL